MPKWVKNIPVSLPKEKVEIINGNAKILNLIDKGNLSFNVRADKSSLIQVNTIYFPGWIAKIDGIKTPINYEDSGLIQLKVYSGSHFVKVYFSETNLRLFADFISLLSLILLITFLLTIRRLKFLSI
jgi:uncharacterized membrane protein YfhO